MLIDRVFWVNKLFFKICFEEKDWPEDLGRTKENVILSDRDLLSLNKQVNDPFIVYYRKKIKVFNRDMFREIYYDMF